MEIGVILMILFSIGSFSQLVNAECKKSPTRVGGSFPKLKQGDLCSGDVIFSENFDKLNEDLWNHEKQVDGAGNGEFQQYVNNREVSFVKDGSLNILPKVVGDNTNGQYFNPVQSARMTTSGKFTFRYGKVESRAKIPRGDWIWPAIWMMPQASKYGSWPRSGEIDIMESRGNKDLVAGGKNIGTQLVASTMHWGKSGGENQFKRTHYEKSNGGGYDGDFHIYTVEWTPDYLAFSVDNQEIGRVAPPGGGFYELGQLSGDNPWQSGGKMAPFDEDFYLILNVAIGGTSGYFPEEATNPGGKPWKNGTPAPQAAKDFWNGNGQWRPTWNEKTSQRALVVDYVKVTAL